MRTFTSLAAAFAALTLIAAEPQPNPPAAPTTAPVATSPAATTSSRAAGSMAPATVTSIGDPSSFTKKNISSGTMMGEQLKGTHLHGIAKNAETGDLYVGDWHTITHFVPFVGTTASNDDSIRRVNGSGVSRLASVPAPNAMVYDSKDHLLYIVTGELKCARGSSGLLFKCGGTHGIVVLDPATGSYHDFAGRGPGYKDATGVEAGFTEPAGIVYDPDNGNFYVVEADQPRVRQVTADAVVTTLVGSGAKGASDGSGVAASFSYPQSITYCAADKNLYVADTDNNEIRKVTLAGVVTTLAGAPDKGYVDGPGATARFDHPWGIACDSKGDVYVSDRFNNAIRKISPAGIVTTFAGSQQEGTVDAVGTDARFSSPGSMMYSPDDNCLYVTDFDSNQIRKVFIGR